MFGYIQDAKTVGTIFINGIAYTLCSASTHVLMKVEMDGKQIAPMYPYDTENGNILLPGLRFGQSCDLLFDVKDIYTETSDLKVTVSNMYKGK
jgi:hypothetical protein